MGVLNKDYLVIVQCEIAMQRCSGYFCEKAFHERTGSFAVYPKEKSYRTIYFTCGGCCGRATQRKVAHLLRQLQKQEQVPKDRVVVQLASCITKDNFHAPPCPHLDYLRTLIARLGVEVHDDTRVSDLSESRRRDGPWCGE